MNTMWRGNLRTWLLNLQLAIRADEGTCRLGDCPNTLPAEPVDKHYCSERCAYEDWLESFV